MSRTREQLDHKLSLLRGKVNDLTPRRVAQRYLPDYFVDRALGSVLTLIGLKMAWSQYRRATNGNGNGSK
jgi:hypothetical protein